MKVKDDSYLYTWNNTISRNHGICCSLIGNKQLSMARVKSGGVMFGFYEFSPEALIEFSPYDLGSYNSDYLSFATNYTTYVSGNELIENTRHGHNEFLIERRELRDINSPYSSLQPDFLVYAPSKKGDNDLLLKNTLNAASEMGIPVLSIDFEEIIDIEVKKIYDSIEMFEDTNDLSLLHEALNAYETGRFDREGYLEKKYGKNIRQKLTKCFIDYIDYLKKLDDKKYIDNKFEQIREIIKIEQKKYCTPNRDKTLMDYDMILKRMED